VKWEVSTGLEGMNGKPPAIRGLPSKNLPCIRLTLGKACTLFVHVVLLSIREISS